MLLADARVRPKALTDWTVFERREAKTLPDLDESSLYGEVRFYRHRNAGDPQ